MNTTDNLAYRFPTSIKAVIFLDGQIILLENERDEFELPGGKLEVNEQPIETVIREVKEELGLDVEVFSIIDSWLYHINPETHVVIITYLCDMKDFTQVPKLSNEHKRLKVCPIEQLNTLNIPKGYVSSINKALDGMR